MVRITVYKKHFHPELADQFLSDGREVGPCPLLKEGQEYFYDGGAGKAGGLLPLGLAGYLQEGGLPLRGGRKPALV